jgi:hypothetical protein
MQSALDHFRLNQARAKALSALAMSLNSLTSAAVDVSDLYRAGLVLSVSALDQFVHDFVRLGMLDIHRGRRSVTDAHNQFRIPLASAKQALLSGTSEQWLEDAVRANHSWQSFQHPDKIADAIRLISSIKLWEAVGHEMSTTARDVKNQLASIVDRRNKIAHEADMDPTNPGERWPIDSAMAESAMDYVEAVVNAIYIVAV